MHDPSDPKKKPHDSDWADNYFSGDLLQSLRKYAYRLLAAGLFTAIIAVNPVAASSVDATGALTEVINTILGLIIDVGALILIAYAAINFIRIGINGVRGGPVKRFAITLGMAILLLMFEGVIQPFIEQLAETGNDAALLLPKTAPMLAALPI